MFFEKYTENLWGRHPSEISPEWGAQRVKGLSIIEIAKNMVTEALHIKSSRVGTLPIDEFLYPKFGPGQLWEITADELEKRSVKIIKKVRVTELKKQIIALKALRMKRR